MGITGYGENNKDNDKNSNNEQKPKTGKKNDFNFISQSDAKNDYNMRKLKEYLDIIQRLNNKTYEERTKIIEEIWSETFLSKLPATIKYGDWAQIKLWKENGRYKMDGTTVQLAPDIVENLYLNEETPLKGYVRDAIQQQQEFEQQSYQEKKESNSSTKKDIDFLNTYYNINITRKG